MINSFLNISDLSANKIIEILEIDDFNTKTLQNKCIGLLFEKYSTRTRLSFLKAISLLGGNYVDIKMDDLNISRNESFEDTFRAMNCYLDGLIYRTSDHDRLVKASQYFDKPIINALSDLSHPCQAISDLYTLKEYFNTLKLKILWIGDMNNVCYSFSEVANLVNEIEFFICSPKKISEKINWKINSNIKIINHVSEINLSDINCVMTDVFISMNDQNDDEKINLLKGYCVNSELMNNTSKDSIFMHCLPAKVGLEVSEEVFRSPKSIVWKQAYNRMIAQQKLLQFIYQ